MMQLLTEPEVALVAWTEFQDPGWFPEWRTDATTGGEQLIEFAGRQCYMSFANPGKKTNAEYLRNMLEHGHLSVIEHAQASFAIRAVSRSLTHELVRHRHLSPSQRSQRYVPEKAEATRALLPGPIADDPTLHAIFVEAVEFAQQSYDRLLAGLTEKAQGIEDRTLRNKFARQAARAVMPNCIETGLVLTGNYRAWRHFCKMRGSQFADPEIRALALQILRKLQVLSPPCFGDFTFSQTSMGEEIALPVYSTE